MWPDRSRYASRLYTSQLTDICVKNGGDGFLAEVASREFMDNLISILKVPALNHDVKNKILRYVQDWATAFEGKPSLSYVGEVYKTLQREGEFTHLQARPYRDTVCSQGSTSLLVIPRSLHPQWWILRQHQNGLTQMFACAVGRHLLSPTASTTVVTAVRCLTNNVHPSQCPCRTSVSRRKSGSVTHVTTSYTRRRISAKCELWRIFRTDPYCM